MALAAQAVAAKTVAGPRSAQLAHMVRAATSKTHRAVPADGRMLGGLTSQGNPVVLAVSKNGRQIGVAVADLNMTCTSGDQFTTVDGWSRLAVRTAGKVSQTVALPPVSGSGSSAGVAITGGTDTFSGKLSRKKATFSGTWDLHLTFSLPGGQTDQCDSGSVTFKAVL